MRYFSPAILDGSVTTAKLAIGAVTRIRLNTAVGGASGTIGIQGKVTVPVNRAAFFPDIEADMAASATLDTQMLANFKAVPAATGSVPQFDLRNEDTGFTRDYDVEWEFISG